MDDDALIADVSAKLEALKLRVLSLSKLEGAAPRCFEAIESLDKLIAEAAAHAELIALTTTTAVAAAGGGSSSGSGGGEAASSHIDLTGGRGEGMSGVTIDLVEEDERQLQAAMRASLGASAEPREVVLLE